MRELARVVKPGGRVGMVEFGVPSNVAARALWRLHVQAVMPAVGRVVSREWYEVGRFLGPSIEQLRGAEPNLPGLWCRAGIDHVRLRQLSFGAGLIMWGARRGGSPA
jgi:demethylmenaquinone methyltransferase/2-methoxy-6-polyprenyl-1,4-benzoquinol methylase